MTTGLLERAGSRGGTLQDALLYRLRGYARAQQADFAAARLDLERSLDAARERNARYEMGLTLDAMANVAEACDGAPDKDARREADEIFRSLDVVHVPEVPLGAAAAPETV